MRALLAVCTPGPKVTYIPPPPPEDEGSIFAHYQTGINFDKYDSILVEVSGHSAPPAILVSVRSRPRVAPLVSVWPTWVWDTGCVPLGWCPRTPSSRLRRLRRWAGRAARVAPGGR